ncbi:MAG: hypothetical protein ACR2QM_20040 [Longimicrobiales bacterium]
MFRRAALVGLVTSAAAAGASAQETHIVMIAGLGGDPEYTNAFHGWLSRFADAASERYGVDRARIHYFGEKTELDPTAIKARSTAENIQAGFVELKEAMAPEDELVLLMVGHGTFRDDVARFNIPGPDLTPKDLADLLAGLGERRMTVVNTATASGPFVEALSGPNRTVITATRSGREQNLTKFGLHFVDAFAGEGADLDKDTRVSMLEAFTYSIREVAREYEGEGELLTEHAVLDDNGDGEGSREELGTGAEGDGALARTVFLASTTPNAGGGASTRGVTPALQALYDEKSAIELQISELRAVKEQIPQERYENDLEALLIDLALKNREIRNAGSDR